MTRGKYAQKAALHQAVTTRDAEIETYQHNIARLTADLKAEKDSRKASDDLHRKTQRELLARLNAAASPKMDALNHLLAKARADLDDLRVELRKRDEAHQRFTKGLYAQLSDAAVGQVLLDMAWENARRPDRDASGDPSDFAAYRRAMAKKDAANNLSEMAGIRQAKSKGY